MTDENGNPLDMGRRTRTVTAAQRRALVLRDRHCLGRTPDPDDLLPTNMIDTYYDLDACVAGIYDELERLGVEPALAA